MGKRANDFLDTERCKCGDRHFRCAVCNGIVDGGHDFENRWDGQRNSDWTERFR